MEVVAVRIGILSDTHGLLRREVRNALQGVEVILHAGDVGDKRVLEDLKKIAPVLAVKGNADEGGSCGDLPGFLDVSLEGLRVAMAHRKKDLPEDLSAFGLAVYGHTHRYEREEKDGCLLLNPGSCGPGRLFLEPSLVLADLEGHTVRTEKILPGQRGQGRPGKGQMPEEGRMRETVELIVREVRRRRSVGEISRRHGLSPELVEQVTRLLLTHPGVDTDGILRKMGL